MEKGATIKHDSKNSPKTGDWKIMRPEVDAAKCIGCSTCVVHCPEATIELIERADGNPKKLAEINQEYCKGCGVCAAVCPVKAIVMKK